LPRRIFSPRNQPYESTTINTWMFLWIPQMMEVLPISAPDRDRLDIITDPCERLGFNKFHVEIVFVHL
ncbi:hypothetical protein T05_6216, partial [Trichinella murrelli]